ncbi:MULTISPECIES: WXG100-like domain-containing protein [unclassified Nonomuraea]|uniref:WXG100-like domain-containing protein n=1 Tax=unclassified Nonomuraea TaxID=2593643 RepID=UPI0035BFADA3
MGMKLPAGLAKVMNLTGRQWPMSDEEKLLRMGLAWLGMSGDVGRLAGSAGALAATAWTVQEGASVTAAHDAWDGPDSPQKNLLDGLTGADIIGLGLMVCAAIVLVLKVNFIVQLIQLAIQLFQAMAAAPATMGASTLQVPILMEITGRLLDLCITVAMNGVMGG